MEIYVTRSPKGKPIFEFITGYKKKVKNSWIFLHKSMLGELLHESECLHTLGKQLWCCWDYGEMDVMQKAIILEETNFCPDWYTLVGIYGEEVPMAQVTNEPKEIILLRLED